MVNDEVVLTLFHGLDARRQGEFVQLMRLANARSRCASWQADESPKPRQRLTLVPNCGPTPPARRSRSKG